MCVSKIVNLYRKLEVFRVENHLTSWKPTCDHKQYTKTRMSTPYAYRILRHHQFRTYTTWKGILGCCRRDIPVCQSFETIKGFARPSSKHSGQFSWWWNIVGNWLNGSHKVYGSVRYLWIWGCHWVSTLVRGCWKNVGVRFSWHPFCIDDLVASIRISFIYSFRSQRVPCVVHSKKHTNLYDQY